jgi:hydroxyethylthiazole kinase
MRAPDELPAIAADILGRVREERPRVHCITNTVAQNFTANMLLSAGAVPSMTLAAEEIGAFVEEADALLVNLGTLDAPRRAAIDVAIAKAIEYGVPWLLDPTFADRSEARAAYAVSLLTRAPAGVRLNAQEFSALAESEPEPAEAADFARDIAAVVGLTGATDIVTDGMRLVSIGNGHPLMAKVTTMGCAGSALVAACMAVEDDAWLAMAAGLLVLGVGGEVAGETARGPGSFAVAILDALYGLDSDALRARGRAG